MLWEIVRKEFHFNIITARFILGFVICLMLISASTYVVIQDYSRRLNDYNVAVRGHRDEVLNTRVYSELHPRVDRKPSQMSIFSQGMDKRLVNSFEIYTAAVPAIYDGQKYGGYNPFLAMFPSIDLTFIFQMVLSLLALLFAYDAISGEREGGTLKLMMSNSIPRSSILISKYLSALLSMFPPIVVSVIIAVLMMALSDKVSLSGSDFVRILLIVIVSLLYVSLFYLLGLLISTKTRRTATSLMVAVFAWVFLTLIYPNAGGFLADQMVKAGPSSEQYTQIRELWSEFKRERDRYEKKVVPEHRSSGYTGIMTRSGRNLVYQMTDIRAVTSVKPESAVDALKQFHGYVEPLRIRTADRSWQIRKLALDETYGRKQRLTMNILRLSPAVIYQNVSTILAGTDLGSFEDFMEQAREYRKSTIQYLYNQDAFSSEHWFKYSDDVTVDKLDLSGVPIFNLRGESVMSSFSRGVTDIILLIFLNAVLLILCLTLFIRQEVR